MMFFFRDVKNSVGRYETVAIIEYRGSINQRGESQGHYICDVKTKPNHDWFRTNDNNTPTPISLSDVSRNAYVVLFRKLQ